MVLPRDPSLSTSIHHQSLQYRTHTSSQSSNLPVSVIHLTYTIMSDLIKRTIKVKATKAINKVLLKSKLVNKKRPQHNTQHQEESHAPQAVVQVFTLAPSIQVVFPNPASEWAAATSAAIANEDGAPFAVSVSLAPIEFKSRHIVLAPRVITIASVEELSAFDISAAPTVTVDVGLVDDATPAEAEPEFVDAAPVSESESTVVTPLSVWLLIHCSCRVSGFSQQDYSLPRSHHTCTAFPRRSI
jgi:hypothetical protein